MLTLKTGFLATSLISYITYINKYVCCFSETKKSLQSNISGIHGRKRHPISKGGKITKTFASETALHEALSTCCKKPKLETNVESKKGKAAKKSGKKGQKGIQFVQESESEESSEGEHESHDDVDGTNTKKGVKVITVKVASSDTQARSKQVMQPKSEKPKQMPKKKEGEVKTELPRHKIEAYLKNTRGSESESDDSQMKNKNSFQAVFESVIAKQVETKKTPTKRSAAGTNVVRKSLDEKGDNVTTVVLKTDIKRRKSNEGSVVLGENGSFQIQNEALKHSEKFRTTSPSSWSEMKPENSKQKSIKYLGTEINTSLKSETQMKYESEDPLPKLTGTVKSETKVPVELAEKHKDLGDELIQLTHDIISQQSGKQRFGEMGSNVLKPLATSLSQQEKSLRVGVPEFGKNALSSSMSFSQLAQQASSGKQKPGIGGADMNLQSTINRLSTVLSSKATIPNQTGTAIVFPATSEPLPPEENLLVDVTGAEVQQTPTQPSPHTIRSPTRVVRQEKKSPGRPRQSMASPTREPMKSTNTQPKQSTSSQEMDVIKIQSPKGTQSIVHVQSSVPQTNLKKPPDIVQQSSKTTSTPSAVNIPSTLSTLTPSAVNIPSTLSTSTPSAVNIPSTLSITLSLNMSPSLVQTVSASPQLTPTLFKSPPNIVQSTLPSPSVSSIPGSPPSLSPAVTPTLGVSSDANLQQQAASKPSPLAPNVGVIQVNQNYSRTTSVVPSSPSISVVRTNPGISAFTPVTVKSGNQVSLMNTNVGSLTNTLPVNTMNRPVQNSQIVNSINQVNVVPTGNAANVGQSFNTVNVGQSVNAINVRTALNPVNVRAAINQLNLGTTVNPVNMGTALNPVNVGTALNPVNVGTALNPVNMGTALNPVNVGTPLNQVNVGTPLNQVNVGTPLNQVTVGTPLNQVSVGTPLNQVNVGTQLNQANVGNVRTTLNQVNVGNVGTPLNHMNVGNALMNTNVNQMNTNVSGWSAGNVVNTGVNVMNTANLNNGAASVVNVNSMNNQNTLAGIQTTPVLTMNQVMNPQTVHVNPQTVQMISTNQGLSQTVNSGMLIGQPHTLPVHAQVAQHHAQQSVNRPQVVTLANQNQNFLGQVPVALTLQDANTTQVVQQTSMAGGQQVLSNTGQTMQQRVMFSGNQTFLVNLPVAGSHITTTTSTGNVVLPTSTAVTASLPQGKAQQVVGQFLIQDPKTKSYKLVSQLINPNAANSASQALSAHLLKAGGKQVRMVPVGDQKVMAVAGRSPSVSELLKASVKQNVAGTVLASATGPKGTPAVKLIAKPVHTNVPVSNQNTAGTVKTVNVGVVQSKVQSGMVNVSSASVNVGAHCAVKSELVGMQNDVKVEPTDTKSNTNIKKEETVDFKYNFDPNVSGALVHPPKVSSPDQKPLQLIPQPIVPISQTFSSNSAFSKLNSYTSTLPTTTDDQPIHNYAMPAQLFEEDSNDAKPPCLEMEAPTLEIEPPVLKLENELNVKSEPEVKTEPDVLSISVGSNTSETDTLPKYTPMSYGEDIQTLVQTTSYSSFVGTGETKPKKKRQKSGARDTKDQSEQKVAKVIL